MKVLKGNFDAPGSCVERGTNIVKSNWEILGAAGLGSREKAPQRGIYSSTKAMAAGTLDDIWYVGKRILDDIDLNEVMKTGRRLDCWMREQKEKKKNEG